MNEGNDSNGQREALTRTAQPFAPATGSALACPPGCDHTVQEHTAFDHGLRDGEEGQADSANPYRAHDLREAWLTGHSVGVLNRRAESEAQNDALCESAGRNKTHESKGDVAAPSDSQQQMAMPPSVGNAHNNTENQ